MLSMLFELIEFPEFSAQRTRLFTEDSYHALQLRLLRDPEAGRVIPGTGGIRKLRVGMQGKGTRGGGRVIYTVRRPTGRIYLLTCYAKTEKDDLTPNERRQLRMLANRLE